MPPAGAVAPTFWLDADVPLSEPHAVVSASTATALAASEALRQVVFIVNNSPIVTKVLQRPAAPPHGTEYAW